MAAPALVIEGSSLTKCQVVDQLYPVNCHAHGLPDLAGPVPFRRVDVTVASYPGSGVAALTGSVVGGGDTQGHLGRSPVGRRLVEGVVRVVLLAMDIQKLVGPAGEAHELHSGQVLSLNRLDRLGAEGAGIQLPHLEVGDTGGILGNLPPDHFLPVRGPSPVIRDSLHAAEFVGFHFHQLPGARADGVQVGLLFAHLVEVGLAVEGHGCAGRLAVPGNLKSRFRTGQLDGVLVYLGSFATVAPEQSAHAPGGGMH